jgi:diadenosine tetraphosphate (Ap4A) HIT family hydrolase
VAVPTFGCFTVGYILVLPRAHVTSFGLLDADTLAEADELIASLTARMTRVYGRPTLGFEYGNNVPGGRRVEHAHWHLLPSGADLNGWLAWRLRGWAASSLTALPGSPDASYIAVRDQGGGLSVYPVPNAPRQRIRLRRLVAELDPHVDAEGWDWATQNDPELIRRTVADLGSASVVEG